MYEGSSWEAGSRSASLVIPRLLWNQNFPYTVHNSSPLFEISGRHDGEDDDVVVLGYDAV
jgi:hypothetical protein